MATFGFCSSAPPTAPSASAHEVSEPFLVGVKAVNHNLSFTGCLIRNFLVLEIVHMMPEHFETVKNVMDRPPVHTKTAHFCWQISKMVDFRNGTLTGTF